jgi:hypothetical protein
MRRWLETEIWPHIPPEELDQPPLTKAEVEEILGIGPEGYRSSIAPQCWQFCAASGIASASKRR